MHLTLLPGDRKPAVLPAPHSFAETKSNRYPNPQLRYMVAESRERIAPDNRQITDNVRNQRALESALALLNYLCLRLDEPETLHRTCTVVAKSLADIIAQLEVHNA